MDGHDFINALCAQAAGDASPAEYERRQQALLARLERVRVPFRIRDENGYRRARAIKSALCSLSCYTFNNQLAQDAEVWRLESEWGAELHRWNRRLLLKEPLDIAIGNYLLWNYRLRGQIPTPRVYETARERAILRRWNDEPVVVGLEKKAGDNMFTLDRFGRHHRQYARTIGRQAFWLPGWQADSQTLCDTAAFVASLPELPEDYERVWVRDGKHCARPVRLRRRTLRLLVDHFATPGPPELLRAA